MTFVCMGLYFTIFLFTGLIPVYGTESWLGYEVTWRRSSISFYGTEDWLGSVGIWRRSSISFYGTEGWLRTVVKWRRSSNTIYGSEGLLGYVVTWRRSNLFDGIQIYNHMARSFSMVLRDG